MDSPYTPSVSASDGGNGTDIRDAEISQWLRKMRTHFDVTGGTIVLRIGGALGVNAISIRDAIGTEVARIDSLGRTLYRPPSAWRTEPFAGTWAHYGLGFNDGGWWLDADGVVHLRGMVKSGTIATAAFVLPTGARPVATETMLAVSADAVAVLRVDSGGNVIPQVGNNAWFALDGLSFATAAYNARWIAPTLVGTWVNFGAPYNSAGYWIDTDGFVHLRGVIKSGAANSTAFTLPAGYAPETTENLATENNGALMTVQIAASGAVTPLDSQTTQVSLDGLVFAAAGRGRWQTIGASDFKGGWGNGSGNRAAYCIDSQDTVHLRGVISGGTIGQAAFTLPEKFRPIANERWRTRSGSGISRLGVNTDGSVIPLFGNNTSFVLDGFAFRVAS